MVGGFLDSNSTTGLVNTSLNSSQLGRHNIPVRGGTPSFPQSSPFTVTKTGDANDGLCGVNDCSLREAIASGDSGDAITIPAGTYTLTLGSQLTIDKNLTLTGAGSGDTIIQAATGSGIATFRVISISNGSNVAISGVTIRHGNPPTDGGAGIFSTLSTLTLTESTISGNSSPGAAPSAVASSTTAAR